MFFIFKVKTKQLNIHHTFLLGWFVRKVQYLLKYSFP